MGQLSESENKTNLLTKNYCSHAFLVFYRNTSWENLDFEIEHF